MQVAEGKEGRIDVNVLLVQLVHKSRDHDEFLHTAEKVLSVAESFERHRVENFKRAASAVIEVKRSDPDEIDRRLNERIRRILKLTVGTVMLASTGGALFNAMTGGSLILSGLWVIMGSLALGIVGPLATGGPIGAADVVRIVAALRGALELGVTKEEAGTTTESEITPQKGGEGG